MGRNIPHIENSALIKAIVVAAGLCSPRARAQSCSDEDSSPRGKGSFALDPAEAKKTTSKAYAITDRNYNADGINGVFSVTIRPISPQANSTLMNKVFYFKS